MKKLSQASFSAIASDHIISCELPFIENWIKDHCEKFMSRNEVYDICQNHILWSAYYFKYGIKETKKLFWEHYEDVDFGGNK